MSRSTVPRTRRERRGTDAGEGFCGIFVFLHSLTAGFCGEWLCANMSISDVHECSYFNKILETGSWGERERFLLGYQNVSKILHNIQKRNCDPLLLHITRFSMEAKPKSLRHPGQKGRAWCASSSAEYTITTKSLTIVNISSLAFPAENYIQYPITGLSSIEFFLHRKVFSFFLRQEKLRGCPRFRCFFFLK